MPDGTHRKNATVLLSSFRNEAPFVLEFVAHHKVLGFDQIIIASNDCTDGTVQILDALQAMGVIRHMPCQRDRVARECTLTVLRGRHVGRAPHRDRGGKAGSHEANREACTTEEGGAHPLFSANAAPSIWVRAALRQRCDLRTMCGVAAEGDGRTEIRSVVSWQISRSAPRAHSR